MLIIDEQLVAPAPLRRADEQIAQGLDEGGAEHWAGGLAGGFFEVTGARTAQSSPPRAPFCAAAQSLGSCSHFSGYGSLFMVKIAQTWAGVVVQLQGAILSSNSPGCVIARAFTGLLFGIGRLVSR